MAGPAAAMAAAGRLLMAVVVASVAEVVVWAAAAGDERSALATNESVAEAMAAVVRDIGTFEHSNATAKASRTCGSQTYCLFLGISCLLVILKRGKLLRCVPALRKLRPGKSSLSMAWNHCSSVGTNC